MFERLHRGDHDLHAVNRLVAGSDDRLAIDQALSDQELQEQKDIALTQAEQLWESSGLEGDFNELADVLGASWTSSRGFPLVNVPSFPSRDIVPRPVMLGARQIECSRVFAEQDVSDGMVALHGKVLFYRTQVSSRPDKADVYQDRGFYTFIAQIRDDDSGRIIPSIVYGDLDAADWSDDPLKALFVYDVLKARKQIKDADLLEFLECTDRFGGGYADGLVSTSYMDHDSIMAMLSRSMKNRLFRKGKTIVGVFRQNQTAYIENDETFRLMVRDAMQTFIDRYVEPAQTVDAVPEEASRKAELGRLTHELTKGTALNEFDLAHAGLRTQIRSSRISTATESVIKPRHTKLVDYKRCMRIILQEESDFPFLRTLNETLPATIITFGEGGYDYLLRDLLYELDEKSLRAKLTSSQLTSRDKEIIKKSYNRQSPLIRHMAENLGWSLDDL